jgi:hypothetical protein
MRITLLSSLIAVGILGIALPGLAADVIAPVIVSAPSIIKSIGLQDFNHDGRIDRAVVTIDNPSNKVWQVHGTRGIGISYQGNPLPIRTAFMSSNGNPATLEIVLENDGNLPATTSAEGFEVTYSSQGAASGVSDGMTELSVITTGDSGPADTELDQAAPILLSSSPADGTLDTDVDTDLTLTFSESVVQSSLVPTSVLGAASWSFTVAGNVVTAPHTSYDVGSLENFGIDARDAAGNHLVVGPYSNPFVFRTSEEDEADPHLDNVFTLTTPQSLGVLQAGMPSVLAWYTNQTNITDIRLSYTADGGISYQQIATKAVSDGTFVWYPPAGLASIQLRAEGLNASGAAIDSATVSTVSVIGAAVAPLSISSAPVVMKLSPTSVRATLEVSRPPASATAVCGSISAVVKISGDRPTRIDAEASGLAEGLTTCRFSVNDSSNEQQVVVTEPFTVGNVATSPGPTSPGEIDLIKSDSSSAVYWRKDGKRFLQSHHDFCNPAWKHYDRWQRQDERGRLPHQDPE